MNAKQKTRCLVVQTRQPEPIENPVIVQRVEEGEKLGFRNEGLDRLREELLACEQYGTSYSLAPSYSSTSLRHIGRMARKQKEKHRRGGGS